MVGRPGKRLPGLEQQRLRLLQRLARLGRPRPAQALDELRGLLAPLCDRPRVGLQLFQQGHVLACLDDRDGRSKMSRRGMP